MLLASCSCSWMYNRCCTSVCIFSEKLPSTGCSWIDLRVFASEKQTTSCKSHCPGHRDGKHTDRVVLNGTPGDRSCFACGRSNALFGRLCRLFLWFWCVYREPSNVRRVDRRTGEASRSGCVPLKKCGRVSYRQTGHVFPSLRLTHNFRHT